MKRQTRIASIIIAAAGIAVADPVVPQVVYPTHEMDAVHPVVPVPPAPVTRPEGQVVQITRPSFGVRTRNILIVADRSATQLATAHGLTRVQSRRVALPLQVRELEPYRDPKRERDRPDEG